MQKWEYKRTYHEWSEWEDKNHPDFDRRGWWEIGHTDDAERLGYDKETYKWKTREGSDEYLEMRTLAETEHENYIIEELNIQGADGWELVSVEKRGIEDEVEWKINMGIEPYRLYWKRAIEK